MILSLFSSRSLAESFYREIVSDNKENFVDYITNMQSLFEDALNSYASLGTSIQTALAEQTQQPVTVQKIGRNETCPCGSGKKYKKCCLQ